jgi:uncharacterized OB-fold protein
MIYEGDITIPYKWTAGPAAGRFLAELKENARIVGARCGGCGKVYVPPPDVCADCFKPTTEWVELSGDGVIVAATDVERSMPWSPLAAPYRLALIRLDGADTNLVHLVGNGLGEGQRVRAIFSQQRSGSLLDIERFDSTTANAQGEVSSQEGRADFSQQKRESKGESGMGEYTPEQGAVSDVTHIFRALASRFKKGVATREISYYFSIDEEKWTVFVTPEICEVREGKAVEQADCFLKTSAQIFVGTVKGDYTPSFMDLMSGKIKTNNPALLQTFKDIFGD